jgi:hypothetical protein
MEFAMNIDYRQCYRPEPSLSFPNWVRRLWIWL